MEVFWSAAARTLLQWVVANWPPGCVEKVESEGVEFGPTASVGGCGLSACLGALCGIVRFLRAGHVYKPATGLSKSKQTVADAGERRRKSVFGACLKFGHPKQQR